MEDTNWLSNIILSEMPKTKTNIQTKTVSTIKRYIGNALKNHFGFELLIPARIIGSDNYNDFLNWTKKFDKHPEKHIKPNIAFGNNESIINSEYILCLTKKHNTFAFIRTGDIYMENESINSIMSKTDSSVFDVYVYIFGKKSFYFYNQLCKIINKKGNRLTTFKISSGDSRNDEDFKAIASDMNLRKLDTIFLENNVIAKIKNHIDQFLDNENIYKSRNLLYKTGILLEGEPGTGKTSLANAIATEYGCDLIIIDMNDFKNINTYILSEIINADEYRYIVLLEDIDCVITDREDKSADKDDKALVNKMLQFLDSNSSPTNVIFIATTNHPEKLDAAIKRSGRFDLIVSVKGIYEEKAREMCKSFDLNDNQTNRILKDVTYPVNQSYLQNKILQSFKKEVIIEAE